MTQIKLMPKQPTSGSESSSQSDNEDEGINLNQNIVTKEDIAELFEPVLINPLILTEKKVKRTRDGFQEAISVLN